MGEERENEGNVLWDEIWTRRRRNLNFLRKPDFWQLQAFRPICLLALSICPPCISIINIKMIIVIMIINNMTMIEIFVIIITIMIIIFPPLLPTPWPSLREVPFLFFPPPPLHLDTFCSFCIFSCPKQLNRWPCH